MICGQCGKNEAAVFLKQLAGNKVTQAALCSACAEDQGLGLGHPGSPLMSLLSGMGGLLAPARTVPSRNCRSCGLRFSQFMDSGRLGCRECYETFQKPLSSLLKRIHGADRHVGLRPAARPSADSGSKTPAEEPGTGEATRRLLRQKIQAAVAREDFEEAARLRDLLRGPHDKKGM